MTLAMGLQTESTDTATVSEPYSFSWKRVTLRALGAVLVTGSVVLLLIAARLEPSRSGLGTHHQLGLPPCTIRVVFGIRCPSCGMTTSWAYLMNGDLVSAARANLGGLLLGVMTIGSFAVTLPMAVRGRMPRDRVIKNATIALSAIVVVSLSEWLWRLWA